MEKAVRVLDGGIVRLQKDGFVTVVFLSDRDGYGDVGVDQFSNLRLSIDFSSSSFKIYSGPNTLYSIHTELRIMVVSLTMAWMNL